MSNGQEAPPTRLIVCVDGESQSSAASLTNIQRINAGITRGNCRNAKTGLAYNQVVQYLPGIGSSEEAISKDRIFGGQTHLKQIQDVYENCSRLTGSRDEVWLFGFSRGAYVVRAVAGLLHTYCGLASAGQPEFGKDFKKLLKEAETRAGTLSLAFSPVSSATTLNRRPAPRIQFVGVFDTIRAVGDDAPFDISFNASVQHLRHAVSIHEDRKTLSPELIYPDNLYSTDLRDADRSFIQAHFIGNHTDMGGSSKKGGLALYPLQWMLFEARQCGLFLTCFDGGYGETTGLHDPLGVVFPKAGKGDRADGVWSNTTANGITVRMHDLREVHDRMRGQGSDFGITHVSKFGHIRRKQREIFDSNGLLLGYCDWAPQGSIIHPSVYMLMDQHVNVAMENKELRLQRHLEEYRARMLGMNSNGMLNEHWEEDLGDDSVNPGAIRVLVCGNTGVGKSTLINKTFGVDVTTSSNRFRGIHDVREEITFEGRPDLIVHDSGGFEAGADDEFKAIEEFLKTKSAAVDVMQRLHVIWFCVDINSSRTLQTATEKLFQAVGKYAEDVPIIVVATKKDDFVDIAFSARRKEMKKQGLRFDEDACEEYAEEKLRERVEMIREEMLTVPGGRLDACVAISQDDEDSIKELSKTTSRCFDTEKIRALYIRAQVSRIDLKVDLALGEIYRRYKKLIRSTTGTTFAPGGATINKNVTTNAICKAIINCFGLPTISANTALEALKSSVWNNVGTNVGLALADTLQAIGLTGTVFAAGIPAWLVTGSISTPYVVPATCRLFLIMACDLTFVLARSFKEVTFRTSGQPNEKDVSSAARVYRLRGYSAHVHAYLKKLVPRRNLAAAYRVDAIKQGIEDMFTEYKDKLMEDVDLPLKVSGLKIGSTNADDDSSTIASSEGNSELLADLRDARDLCAKRMSTSTADVTSPTMSELAETMTLDESSVAELDASTPIAEIDGLAIGHGAVELDASKSTVELPADTKLFELGDTARRTDEPRSMV